MRWSEKTVTVAKGRANRVCTAKKVRHAGNGVGGDSRRSKRHVRGGGTRQECNDGGDEAYDITQGMPAGCTQPGAPHQNGARRATAATEGRRGGMQRRGRKRIVRQSPPRSRGGNVSATACQHVKRDRQKSRWRRSDIPEVTSDVDERRRR
jgi:hypothetical protein